MGIIESEEKRRALATAKARIRRAVGRDAATEAESRGGGFLACLSGDLDPADEQKPAPPRGLGVVVWVSDEKLAGELETDVPRMLGWETREELERLARRYSLTENERQRYDAMTGRMRFSVKTIAAETLTVSETPAHSVRMLTVAQLKERAHTDGERRELTELMEREPDARAWRLRLETGTARRVQWFDRATGRRRQANVGDLLVVVHESLYGDPPELRRADESKKRPTADERYKYVLGGVPCAPVYDG